MLNFVLMRSRYAAVLLGRAGLILEAEMYLISCGLNLNLVLWL